MSRSSIVFACIMLFAATAVNAAYFSGKASSSSGFAYLGKFCFRQSPNNVTSAGHMKFNFPNDPNASEQYYIALYDDQSTSWYSVYKQGLSCSESLPFARNWGTKFDTSNVIWGDNAMAAWSVEEVKRPRFWWVALVNCYQTDAAAFSGIDYSVHFEQDGLVSWNTEFSVNEMGLNSQYLACFFFFFGLLMIQLYSVKQQMNTGRVHPLVKLYTVSLALQFWSVLFYLCHWGKYTNDGVGAIGAQAMGEICDAAARITLVIMLILLAQGWTIARDEIQHKYAVLGAAAVLSIVYFAFVIWDLTGRDTVTTLYVYDGAAGYFIIVLITICAFWFTFYIARSYRAENDETKATLFLRIGVAYFLWFLSLPLLVLIALGIDPWDREKTVSGMLITVALLAYTGMNYMLWHTRTALYFKIDVPDLHTNMRDENL